MSVLRKLLNELLMLAVVTAAFGVLLKILLPLSSLAEISRLIAGVFWLFVLPGYCIMLPWQKELVLMERAVIGMLAAAGLLAIASYYLGMAGVHIRSHTVLLPALVIAASGALCAWRARTGPTKSL